MKREIIEKVIRAMMKYDAVKVELLGLVEDERAKELVEFVYEDILKEEEEERIREIEAILNGFAETLSEDTRKKIMTEEYSFTSYKRYINAIRASWLESVLDLQELGLSVEYETVNNFTEKVVEQKNNIKRQTLNDELKYLLSNLQDFIENSDSITSVVENGLTREVTDKDKLELIKSEWEKVKGLLLQQLCVDLYED